MPSAKHRSLFGGIIGGVAERPLNLLLLVVPVSWVMWFAAPGSVWLFVLAAWPSCRLRA
jgi:hypothetical protein